MGQARNNSLYVWTGVTTRRPRHGSPEATSLLGSTPVTARAAIGDELRRPALWCELGDCISRFSHRSALGEQDNRRRALVAGWRQDAFGRWLCPGCLDRHPYWNAQSLSTRRAVLAERGVRQSEQQDADRAAAIGYRPAAVSAPAPRDHAASGSGQFPVEPEPSDDGFWHNDRSARHRRR